MPQHKTALDQKNTAAPVAVGTASVRPAFRLSARLLETVLLLLVAALVVSYFIQPQPPKLATKLADITASSATLTKTLQPAGSALIGAEFDPFYRDQSGGAGLSGGSKAQKAPESTLKITLYGVRAGQNGQGSVILKLQGEKQQLARTGDRLSPSIQLVGVYADYIEITRGGRRESVAYSDRKIPVKTNQQTKQATSSKAAETLIPLLDLQPFRRNNRITGFQIGDQAQALVLLSAGLVKGDIIRAVGGEPLISFERINELPAALAGASSIKLTIERRGAPLDVTVDITALSGEGNIS